MQFCPSRDDGDIVQRGNRSYLNQENVDNMEAAQVVKVPPISNGPIKYEVEYNEKDPLHSMTDNFNWGRSQPCRLKGFCTGGQQTLQICRGSLECQNPKCQYRKIHRFTNKVDFNRTNTCTLQAHSFED